MTDSKSKAKRGLVAGLRDGTLEKIASEMPPDLDSAGSHTHTTSGIAGRDEIGCTEVTPATDQRDLAAPTTADADADADTPHLSSDTNTKSKAKRGLLTGLRDGTLEKIASEMPPDLDGAAGATEISELPVELDGAAKTTLQTDPISPSKDTKAKAKRGLLTGLRDGTLEKIASEMPPDVDVMADTAQLTAAQTDQGSSSEPVADVRNLGPSHETKAKAQRGLLAGLRDGSLERIASEMPPDIDVVTDTVPPTAAPTDQGSCSAPTADTRNLGPSHETKAKAQRGLLRGLRDGTLEKVASSMPSEVDCPVGESSVVVAVLSHVFESVAQKLYGSHTQQHEGISIHQSRKPKSAVEAAEGELRALLDDTEASEESAAEAARLAARSRIREHKRQVQKAVAQETIATPTASEKTVESEVELRKRAAAETKRRRAEAERRRQRAEREREKRLEEIERLAEEERVRMEERKKELEEMRQKEKEEKQARRRAEKEAKEKQVASAQAEVEKCRKRLKQNQHWKSPSGDYSSGNNAQEKNVRLPPIPRGNRNERELRGAPDANLKCPRKRPAPINVDSDSAFDDEADLDEKAEEAQRQAQDRIKAYRKQKMKQQQQQAASQAAQQVFYPPRSSVPAAPPVQSNIRRSVQSERHSARQSAAQIDTDALMAQIASGMAIDSDDLLGQEAPGGNSAEDCAARNAAYDRIRAYRDKERERKATESKQKERIVKQVHKAEEVPDKNLEAKRKIEQKKAAARIKERRLKEAEEQAAKLKAEEEAVKAKEALKAENQKASQVPRVPDSARQKPRSRHRARHIKEKAPSSFITDDAELADDEDAQLDRPKHVGQNRRLRPLKQLQPATPGGSSVVKPSPRPTPRAAQAAAKREAMVERESKRAALEQETAQCDAKATELEEMLLQAKDGSNTKQAISSLPLQLVEAHCQAAKVKVKLLRHLLNVPLDVN
eukprot:gnl/MRDRNA2_/MRDRNA2_36290_c0_seq1.p1 gnl/MRDRNA2_/MRDRNA2_36290_c0~~gnl/MRDRNA2_/MRDRNA2_36290_c0_seq1.p1  ORF type:complete len:954 (-),score=267.69 gnl/MRDRNA2_/MRDRNA2_36290_c0_seq1:180-3041(-)